MSDRPAPMTDAEHRLLSHFLSPGTRVTERTMAAVHAYRDEVLREAAANGSEDRPVVSARTDEGGVVHVEVRDGARVYELQGRPVVAIEETSFPVEEWCRVRFVLEIPDAKQVTARMEPRPAEADPESRRPQRCPCGHDMDSDLRCLNGRIYGPCKSEHCDGPCTDTYGFCSSDGCLCEGDEDDDA